MQLEIRGQNVRVSDELRTHVERRLEFGLGRFRSRLLRVTVRLADVNGPRGGVDKRCRISVELLPKGSVVIEDLAPDLFSAVDAVVDRLARAVEREVSRAQEYSRPSRWEQTLTPSSLQD